MVNENEIFLFALLLIHIHRLRRRQRTRTIQRPKRFWAREVYCSRQAQGEFNSVCLHDITKIQKTRSCHLGEVTFYSTWRLLKHVSSRTRSLFCLPKEGNIKRTYVEKISVTDIDPFLVPQEKRTLECLLPVESCDLLSYLMFDTSFYTKEQFKNFKSLLECNQMVSGLFTGVTISTR